MARLKVALQAEFPYHVTARCINREWFKIPMAEVWDIMGEQLFFIQRAYAVRVIAFVLMNNHFHLIIQTPECNLDCAMGWFMRESTRALNRAGNRMNQTFGGRFFRSILGTEWYLLHAYKYVYLNPIRAGLADRILDYPFSSLPGVLGLRPLAFAVHDNILLSSVDETLTWLEQIPERESWDAVQKALRRRIFRLAMVNKKPHPLETALL